MRPPPGSSNHWAVTLFFAARVLLALEALACLWLGRLAWRAARFEDRVLVRAIGPALGAAAAGIIIYGLTQS